MSTQNYVFKTLVSRKRLAKSVTGVVNTWNCWCCLRMDCWLAEGQLVAESISGRVMFQEETSYSVKCRRVPYLAPFCFSSSLMTSRMVFPVQY